MSKNQTIRLCVPDVNSKATQHDPGGTETDQNYKGVGYAPLGRGSEPPSGGGSEPPSGRGSEPPRAVGRVV